MSLHVLAHSICMMMLLWYRLVSKSKPQHKLAMLPTFKENTLINLHWLWNAGLLFEFCGCPDWISSFFLNIKRKWSPSKRTHTLIPLISSPFLHSVSLFLSLTLIWKNSQYFHSGLSECSIRYSTFKKSEQKLKSNVVLSLKYFNWNIHLRSYLELGE